MKESFVRKMGRFFIRFGRASLRLGEDRHPSVEAMKKIMSK